MIDPAVRAATDTLAYRVSLALARGVPRLDIEQLILAAFTTQARGLGWPDIREIIRLAEVAPAAMGDDRERHAREGKAGGGSSAPTQDEGVDPGPSGDDQPASPDLSLIDRLVRLEGQVERLGTLVDAVRRHFGGVVDGLLRKVGANGSTDPHSLDHRVAELERQAKTAGQVASATKNGSPVENPSYSQASITDEELAEMAYRPDQLRDFYGSRSAAGYAADEIVRLIAALQASRLDEEGIDPRPAG